MKTLSRNHVSSAIILALFVTLFIGTSFAQQSSTDARPATQTGSEAKLPDTAAGKTFAAFLKAFNSGDIEIMRKFHTQYAGDPDNAQKDLEFYQQSGGIKVISVAKSSDQALEVIVETKNGSRRLNFAIEVDKNEPYGIQSIRVQPV